MSSETSNPVPIPFGTVERVVPLPDGRLLLCGIDDARTPCLAVLDTVTRHGSEVAFAHGCSLDIHSAVGVSPTSVLIGGYLPPDPGVVVDVDPLCVKPAPPRPVIQSLGTAAPLGGDGALLAGGLSTWDPRSGARVATQVVTRYADSQWTLRSPLLGPRVHGVGTWSSKGRVVLSGGASLTQPGLLSVDVYDPSADKWNRSEPTWQVARWLPDPADWTEVRGIAARSARNESGRRRRSGAPPAPTWRRAAALSDGRVALSLAATDGTITIPIPVMALFDPVALSWSEPVETPSFTNIVGLADGRVGGRGYTAGRDALFTWSEQGGRWEERIIGTEGGSQLAALPDGRAVVGVNDDRALLILDV